MDGGKRLFKSDSRLKREQSEMSRKESGRTFKGYRRGFRDLQRLGLFNSFKTFNILLCLLDNYNKEHYFFFSKINTIFGQNG